MQNWSDLPIKFVPEKLYKKRTLPIKSKIAEVSLVTCGKVNKPAETGGFVASTVYPA
jgi:hypothetical protein